MIMLLKIGIVTLIVVVSLSVMSGGVVAKQNGSEEETGGPDNASVNETGDVDEDDEKESQNERSGPPADAGPSDN